VKADRSKWWEHLRLLGLGLKAKRGIFGESATHIISDGGATDRYKPFRIEPTSGGGLRHATRELVLIMKQAFSAEKVIQASLEAIHSVRHLSTLWI
jgi:hypothetical protein